jgi:hypothetical protein
MFQIKLVFLNFQNILKVIFQIFISLNKYFIEYLHNKFTKIMPKMHSMYPFLGKTLVLFFSILLLNSCGKTKEIVKPDFQKLVIGTYVGKLLRLGGREIPLPLTSDGNTIEVEFEVTAASSPETANLKFTFKQNNKGVRTKDVEDFLDLQIVEGLNSEILLQKENKTTATVKGNLIDLSFEFEGVVASFIGQKI